jgi:hypothetical protein
MAQGIGMWRRGHRSTVRLNQAKVGCEMSDSGSESCELFVFEMQGHRPMREM